MKEKSKILKKTLKSFLGMVPALLSVTLLISLIHSFIPKEFYYKIFTGNKILDSLIGATAGSIATGNPINSYILGGEMLKYGVSMVAVLAFIISWVTVGMVQIPAESSLLGKRFAIVRNIVSFILSIFMALLIVVSIKYI